jgi:hypothetical protein
LLVLAVVVGLTMSSLAMAAQSQYGGLYGQVVDAQGSGLPGAVVTLSGPDGPQVQVTDADGRFRYLGLSPGDYDVKIELEGFATTTHPSVSIRGGRNATLEAPLSTATQAEEIVVNNSSSALDTRRATSSTTVTRDELERLPTARDVWSIVTLTPGVLTDRINVGGNESGEHQSFVMGGTPHAYNRFYVDGVDVTDVSRPGGTPDYYDFSSLEEIRIVTGGGDASLASGGLGINIVTRRGTNEFGGFANYFLTDEAFGSSLDPFEDQRGGQILDRDTDYGAALGGPILRDRLWFFASGNRQDVDRTAFAAGNRVAADFSLDSYAAKLNAQLTEGNRVNGLFHLEDYTRFGDGASFDRAPETTWNRSGSPTIFKFEDTHIFSSNFYLTGLASFTDAGFTLLPPGGAATPWVDAAGTWRGSYFEQQTERTSRQFNADASYFFNTGGLSHELKFGAGQRNVSDTTTWQWPGNTFSFFEDPFQEPIAVFPTANTAAVDVNYGSLYVQDSLTSGAFTLNLGLRYDAHTGTNAPSSVLGNPLRPATVPGGAFGGSDPIFDWNLLAPRIGVAYDLFGNGKSKLYASYGRFLPQLPLDLVAAENPIERSGPFLGAEAFRFIDVDNDRAYDSNEPKGGSITVGGARADNPFFFNPNGGVAQDMQAPYTQEFLGGIEFEVARSVSLGVRYVHRSIPRVLDEYGLIGLVEGEFGRPATLQDFRNGPVVNGIDLTGDPFDVQTFELRQPWFHTGGTLFTTGERRQDYDGIALTFNKRLANRWLLRGGFTYHDWAWQVPDGSLRDPNDLIGSQDNDGAPVAEQSAAVDKQGVFLSSRWTAQVAGLYEIAPERPWSFHVAGNVLARDGYPAPLFVTVTGGDDVTRQIQVGNVGDQRLDDVLLVDVRVGKDFGGLTVAADVFNVLDDNTVIQRNGDLLSGRKGLADEFVSPRTFRFGVRFRF